MYLGGLRRDSVPIPGDLAMSALRTAWLAWGAVVALLAYPAQAQVIGQQSSILGGEEGFFRPTGGGVVPWTPAFLPSLALWLDAEDASTITLNGATVSQWDDKSGNGNHVSNATAATQPAYLTTGWNGKPTVSFTETGGEFLFKSGVSNFESNEDFTIAGAFEFLQTSRAWDMIAGWRSVPNSNSGTAGAPVLQGMSTSQQIGYHDTDRVDNRIAVAVTTRLGKKIATISRSGGTNGTGGAATATCTGFSQATYDTNTTQTWNSSTATGFQIGGRQQSATQYGNKYISEVVGCNTKLSTEDRQKLEGYLAWKWGVEADLPADHPYKSAPPTTGGASTVTIDAMPYTRTVTCDTITVTGTYTGTAPTTWSASPSGDTGSCTNLGGGTFSCVVDVDPDASGEGVETITIGNDSVDIGFYVAGSHSCFLAQSVDGSYNSTLADSDPVATWENLGSSALDVTQGTAANQPTFKTAIVGGNPVVRCDGGDGLNASTASDWTFLHNGTDNTIDSVALKSGTGAISTIVATKTGSDGILGTRHTFLNTNLRAYRNVAAGGPTANAVSANNAVPNNQFHLITSSVDDDGGAGADVFLWTNGTEVSAAGIAYSASDASPLAVCFDTSGINQLTGDLFRVLIYQSALDATQRDINQAVDEWALGGTFPVTP
jgi:hypothetical protein